MSTTLDNAASTTAPAGIDPRGPQFAAAITSVVLIAALALPTAVALPLALAQAVVFATGVAAGVQHTPYARLFKAAVRPRLSPPSELEDPQPPRFAQGVGLVFLLVAVAGFVAGATVVAQVALGFALVAALLNASAARCTS